MTSLPFVEAAPVWSPDGKELAFGHVFVGDGRDAIIRKKIGGGVEETLIESSNPSRQIWPSDWSPDGKYIVYCTGQHVTALETDIHVLPLDGSKPFPYLATVDDEFDARISPNGRWLVYSVRAKNRTDEREVFVIPFTPESPPKLNEDGTTELPKQRWRISVGGGSVPVWSPDGKRIYYVSDNGDLMAVDVDTEGESLLIRQATPLFQTAFEPGKSFDMFLSDNEDNADAPERYFFNEVSVNIDTPTTVILNWDTELKK